MCTLAIYYRTSLDFPIVVAANRDEFYARASAPAQRLVEAPWVVGGQDLVAGGTWLGVNAHHLVAGILNRRSNRAPDPACRSRGHLCLDVLREATMADAVAHVCGDSGTLYNPFNLLLASPDGACVVGNISGRMVPTTLTPGLHLLTNLELDDVECPRIAKSYGLFDALRSSLQASTLPHFVHAIGGILADHSTPLDPRDTGTPNNLCVHGERFGTRSSTLLLYAASTSRFRMWHAAGPPCQTAYREIPLPGAATEIPLDKPTGTG